MDAILAELEPCGAKLEITTNGTQLTARNLERLLPVAHFAQVSCDGASQRIFENLRLGARYREFLHGVKLLALTAQRVRDLYQPGLTCSFVHSPEGSSPAWPPLPPSRRQSQVCCRASTTGWASPSVGAARAESSQRLKALDRLRALQSPSGST